MSERDVLIREYQAQDQDSVVALAPRLVIGIAPWRDACAALRAEQWLADSCSAAVRGDAGLFVALRGGTLVGAVSVAQSRHFTGDVDAYVGELAVVENAARHGIGRALMAHVDGWAREHGARCITLHTGAANADAREFYSALGFEIEDVRLTRTLAAAGDDSGSRGGSPVDSCRYIPA